jgi:hypothetical protein
VIPTNIGAANPVAIAEIKLKRKINRRVRTA